MLDSFKVRLCVIVLSVTVCTVGYICNNYTMGMSGLPDIYTLGPRASGVYIRRTTSAHGITTM